MRTRNTAHPAFFILAAIEFLFAFIFSALKEFGLYVVQDGLFMSEINTIFRILLTVLFLGLFVSLLFRKMTIFTGVLFAMMTGINLYWVYTDIFVNHLAIPIIYVLEMIFLISALILLTVMVFISSGKKTGAFLKLWFLPLIFVILYYLCACVEIFSSSIFSVFSLRDYGHAYYIYAITMVLNMTFGLFAQFMGLFFSCFAVRKKAVTQTVPTPGMHDGSIGYNNSQNYNNLNNNI